MADDEFLAEAVEPDPAGRSSFRLVVVEHRVDAGDLSGSLPPPALGDHGLESPVPVGVDGAGLVGAGGQDPDAPVFADEALKPSGFLAFLFLAYRVLDHSASSASQ